MLERYKKMQDGVSKLAELLETTAPSKQKNIYEVGNKEDSLYMAQVLSVVLEWQDVLALPPSELAELLYIAKAPMIALAVLDCPQEIKDTFLKTCKREKMGQVKDLIEYPKTTNPSFMHSARMDLVKNYRELVNLKKIQQPKKNSEDVKKRLGFI